MGPCPCFLSDPAACSKPTRRKAICPGDPSESAGPPLESPKQLTSRVSPKVSLVTPEDSPKGFSLLCGQRPWAEETFTGSTPLRLCPTGENSRPKFTAGWRQSDHPWGGAAWVMRPLKDVQDEKCPEVDARFTKPGWSKAVFAALQGTCAGRDGIGVWGSGSSSWGLPTSSRYQRNPFRACLCEELGR